MQIFSNPNISIALKEHLPRIEVLLNHAYRGEESKKGWTSETHLIDGVVRSSLKTITETYNKQGSVFLLYSHENNIEGCVNLQIQNSSQLYLGMFAVNPIKQGLGIGKSLLKASEEYSKSVGCNCIYMTVINVRTELINWYERHGYINTHKLIPFNEDGEHGKHLQELYFTELVKYIKI